MSTLAREQESMGSHSISAVYKLSPLALGSSAFLSVKWSCCCAPARPPAKDLQYGLAEIMSRPVEILGSCTCRAYHQSKAMHFIHYLRTCMPYLAKCLPCHRRQIATEHNYCTYLNISWITRPSHQKHFLSRIST